MTCVETFVTEKLVIFAVATYGEGESTDNAARFSGWLEDKEGLLEPGALSSLKFTVFGLGNRQYEHFNAQGKRTNAGLERHGAQRVFEYGEVIFSLCRVY